MKKSKWLILLSGFLFVIIIATFTVENIYYDSLPTVEKVFPGPNFLTSSHQVSATLVYGRDEHTVRVESDFSSISLLLKNGAKVWEGLAIYRVAPAEIMVKMKAIEVSIFDLKQQNEELLKDDEASFGRNAIMREKNLWQIEVLNEEMEKLKTLSENEGIAYAEYPGYIYYFVHQDAAVQSGQRIAMISYDTGDRFIKWQLPADEAAHMEIGSRDFNLGLIGSWIEVSLEVRRAFHGAGNEILAVVPREYQILVSKVEYNLQRDVYELTAQIVQNVDMDLKDLIMEDGAVIDGISRYKSRVIYDIVVPTDAIEFDNDLRGSIYVLDKRQRIYGEEYYVRKMSVEAIRTLFDQTALRNAGLYYEVVTKSDKPLSHKTAVKILEPMGE